MAPGFLQGVYEEAALTIDLASLAIGAGARIYASERAVDAGGAPSVRRILDAVPEPHAVQRLLGVLGLAAQPPPRLPVSAHT
jgi:hypothetical protein